VAIAEGRCSCLDAPAGEEKPAPLPDGGAQSRRRAVCVSAGPGRPVGPCLPRSWASDCRDRSTGPTSARAAGARSLTSTTSLKRTWIESFRPIRSKGRSRCRCGRSSSGCTIHTAARSVCSSCIWTICWCGSGCRCGWRVRKPHPARPQAAVANLPADDHCRSLRGVHPKAISGSEEFFARGLREPDSAVEMAIERAASQEIQDVVMAMAHRGRLNVLANIMGKSPQRIFREFADLDPELHVGRGDVKYHLGHSTDYVAEPTDGRSTSRSALIRATLST
jgi:hypothetical protein